MHTLERVLSAHVSCPYGGQDIYSKLYILSEFHLLNEVFQVFFRAQPYVAYMVYSVDPYMSH